MKEELALSHLAVCAKVKQHLLINELMGLPDRWLRLLLFGLSCAIVLLSSWAGPIVAAPAEIRGVWLTNVDSNVLFNRDRINNAVTELAHLKFNQIYPVVWNWGYTTYPSAIAQQTLGSAVDPRPDSLQNRDALAEIIQASHAKGIKVMPWFEFGFMVPEDSGLAMRRSDWLTLKQDGSKIWMEGIYPRVWLNPLRPEVQRFIRDLVLEVVTKYDVDGIQFDDHFGLPFEFGYDAFTVNLYKKENQGKRPPTNPKDPAWIKWRADKITEFTRQLFRDVKAQKSKVVFALSPNNYDFSMEHSLQDWRRWEREGLVEELALQVYRDSLTSFQNELDRPEVKAARQHIPVTVGVLSGLRAKPIPMQQIQTQVQMVRDRRFAGMSFFFYETLWNMTAETADQRKMGFQAIFR
ncbi:MAG: hypothetical protein RLZZ511_1334 [Cyanobacteriota bacterium]|jgi:uncharacterized lipoprotein YddW (UPF0748 family)